jgi:two-component system, cell cycle sensor histidine kinase and response regulator CckA
MNLMQNNRILVVDDNPAIHTDFKKILQAASGGGSKHLDSAEAILFGEAKPGKHQMQSFELDSAMQGREAVVMLKKAVEEGRPYALAFVDVRMPPGWDGIETVARMWDAQPDLQVVICTAYSDYSWEDMMTRFGRSDNLLILKKPFDNVEVLQLAHALTRKWQVTKQATMRIEEMEAMVKLRTGELQTAHDRVRSSEERFSKAFHASPIPVAILRLSDARFADANGAFQRMVKYDADHLIGRSVRELELCAGLETLAWPQLRTQKKVHNVECDINSNGGDLRHALVSLEMLDLGGEPHVLMIAEDMTEKIRLEGDLRQAQKMEAVGQLAAGVAHDFNNALTIIQGHASLYMNDPASDPELVDSFSHIANAAGRAARLTRQLLAFSRKQVMRQRPMELNALVCQISSMLPRLIGEHIHIISDLESDIPSIFADDCNMEQIILNLSVNARDAMPDGGTLTIKTEEIEVGDEHLRRVQDAVPGRYVKLSVRDTGTGMDFQTRSHIFEPFFTTKEVGKGTGMGLATVYGIVKQHDGWIEVDSEQGTGTTFSIYLPIHSKNVQAQPMDLQLYPTRGRAGAGRMVLVVEDDAEVRFLVRDILTAHDYQVLEAEDGEHALAVAQGRLNDIALLLTDMVMPKGITGRELARRLTAERADLRVIYTSGYSPDLFDPTLVLEEGVNYLPKPYTSEMLADTLRTALDMQPPDRAVA